MKGQSYGHHTLSECVPNDHFKFVQLHLAVSVWKESWFTLACHLARGIQISLTDNTLRLHTMGIIHSLNRNSGVVP